MRRAFAPASRIGSDLAWMLSLCDLLANCLCAMLLLYALTHLAPPARQAALATVRASFSTVATTDASPTDGGPLDIATSGYWRFWLDRQLTQDPALTSAGVRLADAEAALTLPLPARDDAVALRALAELLAQAGRPALLVAPMQEADSAALVQERLAAYLPAGQLRLAVEPLAGPWRLEIIP